MEEKRKQELTKLWQKKTQDQHNRVQKVRREMEGYETREVGRQGLDSVKDLVLILDAVKKKKKKNCSKKGHIVIIFVFLKDNSGLQYREQNGEKQERMYQGQLG